MKKKIISVLLSLALIFTAVYSVPVFAETIPELPNFIAASVNASGLQDLQTQSNILNFSSEVSGHTVHFAVTFPKEGGIRIYDTDFPGDFTPSSLKTITYTTTGETLRFSAGSQSCILAGEGDGWKLECFAEGTAIYTLHSTDLLFGYNENSRISTALKGDIASGESFIGLGERFSGVVLNGKSFDLWNKDCWSKNNDSYANIPIIHSSLGYSLFYSTYYGGTADIGETDSDAFRFDFSGPEFDLFVFTGSLINNIKSYSALTGTPASAPEWALHYWAGQAEPYWNSSNYLTALQNLIDGYEALGTKPYAIFGEGQPGLNRNSIQLAASYGIKMLAWNHPDRKNLSTPLYDWVLKELYPLLTMGTYPVLRDESGNAIKRDSGSYYFDYTSDYAVGFVRKNTSTLWGYGLKGAMVDYGEYVPSNAVSVTGVPGNKLHNYQAYLYSKAMGSAWGNGTSDSILFARAGSAGSSHYTAQFAGDQKSNFEGLKQAISAGISSSVSGITVWGSDIGGLMENETGDLTDELYQRWLEFSAFSPLMRAHGVTSRNPWSFGSAAQTTFKKYYWIRENFADMLYSANLKTAGDGTPIMAAMAVYDPSLFTVDDQYMYCDNLLVAPVSASKATSRSVVFPKGKWTNLYTAETFDGGITKTVNAPTDEIPVFVKDGALIPVKVDANTLDLGVQINSPRNVLLVTLSDQESNADYLNDSDGVSYTITPTASGYTITSANNHTDALLIYSTDITGVMVNGRPLERLDTKPTGQTRGYYCDAGKGITYISAGGCWDKVSLQSASNALDYSFKIQKNASVSFLDKCFAFYAYDMALTSEPVVHPDKPSDIFAGSNSYATTGYYGLRNNGYLKLCKDSSWALSALTYTGNSYRDFTCEYEFLPGYGIGGMMFGGEKGKMPVTRDSNFDNDSGVIIYMEAEGRLNIGGAIDPATTEMTAGLTQGSQSNFSNTANIKISGMITDGIAREPVKGYADESTQSYTVCVSVSKGVLTVWEKNNADHKVSVKLTRNYKGGYISLLSGIDQNAFKSFSLRGSNLFDFEKIPVSDLDNRFDSYHFNSSSASPIKGMPSEQWTKSNLLNDTPGYYRNTWLKPNYAPTSPINCTLLTLKDATVWDFETSVEVVTNSQSYGIMIAPESQIAQAREGGGLYVDFSNEGYLRVRGDIKVDSAVASGGLTLTRGTRFVRSSEVKGFVSPRANWDSVTVAANKTAYHLHTKVKNGVVTVYFEEMPDQVVTVLLDNKYSGGCFSLCANSCYNGAFKSFSLDIFSSNHERYFMAEKKSETDQTVLRLSANHDAGHLFAEVKVGAAGYRGCHIYEQNAGENAYVYEVNGILYIYLPSAKTGEFVDLYFENSDSVEIFARGGTVAFEDKAVLERKTGDCNSDGSFDIRDLIALKKYAAHLREIDKPNSIIVWNAAIESSENLIGLSRLLLE